MLKAVTAPSPVDEWFAGGERIDVALPAVDGGTTSLRVFVRHEGTLTDAVMFMPGFPDGSFGWSKVLPHLPDAASMGKLFIEYAGMGDSDKPTDYVYSTAERADLLEALWQRYGITSTTLVAFDFSSLVVLEILQRRLERRKRGVADGGPSIRGMFIFNGGLFTDGHSHPWYTTPVLRRIPPPARTRMGASFTAFKIVMKRVMWSKAYAVTDAEIWDLFHTMNRHDGLFYLSAGAGFVADHKAQGDRLDFGRLYRLYRDEIPFLVGASTDDLFEHRQVDLAHKRLGSLGLPIARLPGGHLTTNEQPAALAHLIADFEATHTLRR